MRNILYLNDYSISAEGHYKVTLRLAQYFYASVHLAHVYQFHHLVLPGLDENEDQLSREKIENWLEDVSIKEKEKLAEFARQNAQKQNAMLLGEQYVFEGRVQNEIDSLLGQRAFDLIVLGLHRQTMIENLIWSSLAHHLIDTAKCPLLLLPKQFNKIYLEKIVFATDAAPETISTIFYMLEWAAVFNCQLSIVNISDNEQQREKMLHKFKTINQEVDPDNVFNIDYFCLIGHPVEEIKQFIDQQSADLLVVTTRQRKNWIEKYQQTVTKQLAREIETPLLILNEQDVDHYVITDTNDQIL